MKLKIVLFSAIAVSACYAQALTPPVFESNVYAILPNGDWGAIAAVYSERWYATAGAAQVVGKIFGATAAAEPTSPQTGDLGRYARVKIVQVPNGPMLDKARYLTWLNGFVKEQDLKPFMDLPAHGMQVLTFSSGCKINAGYIVGYYIRNPPPSPTTGRIIQGECGGNNFFMSVVKSPVMVARAIAGKKKYPSFWATGKRPKLRRGRK